MTFPTVLWLNRAHQPHDCEHASCLARIAVGEPLAWLPDGGEGRLLCFNCGCKAEDAALAQP